MISVMLLLRNSQSPLNNTCGEEPVVHLTTRRNKSNKPYKESWAKRYPNLAFGILIVLQLLCYAASIFVGLWIAGAFEYWEWGRL